MFSKNVTLKELPCNNITAQPQLHLIIYVARTLLHLMTIMSNKIRPYYNKNYMHTIFKKEQPNENKEKIFLQANLRLLHAYFVFFCVRFGLRLKDLSEHTSCRSVPWLLLTAVVVDFAEKIIRERAENA